MVYLGSPRTSVILNLANWDNGEHHDRCAGCRLGIVIAHGEASPRVTAPRQRLGVRFGAGRRLPQGDGAMER